MMSRNLPLAIHMNAYNTPANHHFVPQHFLKSWGIDQTNKKVYRYRALAQTGDFEVKKVAIARTASIDGLYKVRVPDGEFEVESKIISALLDQTGSKILSTIQNQTYAKLTVDERKELAVYLVCLEARHPTIIEDMDSIKSRFDELRANLQKGDPESDKLADEIVDYFSSSSIGVMSLSAFVQNERSGLIQTPCSDWLNRLEPLEFTFDQDVLLTSDYPMRRYGDYFTDIFCVVAISPRKALIYKTHQDDEVYYDIPKKVLAKLINIYTLSKATCAYHNTAEMRHFVELYLGWSRKMGSIEAQRSYISRFVEAELAIA